MRQQAISRIVNLLDPGLTRLDNMDVDDARRRVRSGSPDEVRAIAGSFAIVESEGQTVRMARSLDRPMRYFLAKRHEGPALYVGDRIDALQQALARDGLAGQFHPSYTRMVPAHYIVEIALVGCPDPSPAYLRFFTPVRGTLPPDPALIGRRYVEALLAEVRQWLGGIEAGAPGSPIGVAFSGGIDSGAVLLLVHHALLERGLSPARLKAFVLNAGGGEDVLQARQFLEGVCCRFCSRRSRPRPTIWMRRTRFG
jgi:asparagine synthase (glutamine-hydrolysing)